MKFGDFPVARAKGCILAHSQLVGAKTFKKGRELTAEDIAWFKEHDVSSVIAVRLGKNDLNENDAAARVAAALGTGGFDLGRANTGRCNLIAREDGLVLIDKAKIDRLNSRHEAITVSTPLPFTKLKKGDLAATVKIITFGVAERHVKSIEKLIDNSERMIGLSPFRPKRISLIQTHLAGTREQILDKAFRVTSDRVKELGSELVVDIRCDHNSDAVSSALRQAQDLNSDIVLMLGASAIADRRDVIPAAVTKSGGEVEHLGMPVDPGNLMMLASLGNMRILGLPGSARSPRLHGFDWVLQRLAADIPVSGKDLMKMGVGGLLKEMPGRPMPRGDIEMPTPEGHKIAAIILAAGQSRRMGTQNKMTAIVNGKAMVQRAVEAALASKAGPVLVVTGHAPEQVKSVLSDYDVSFHHNPDYADGLSTSLKAGIAALDTDITGAVVCLGDMPGISETHINRLIDAFTSGDDGMICVPTINGKRGNPVLWGRRFFPAISIVSGDVGARHLIGENPDRVVEVEMNDDAILIDLDTPDALQAYRDSE